MLGTLTLAGHGASLTIRGRRIVRQEGWPNIVTLDTLAGGIRWRWISTFDRQRNSSEPVNRAYVMGRSAQLASASCL